ncbi:GNAT family N-acetyltransferase [Flavobacterium agricola]|uniref:GNAT family N-acetyltransferase n=1 Tax=Flavobacterium agricola TaxID=2870839 RepID=A0ABY6LZ49_9FLAO|nr:GNAT family N-acetyltransferase [Flavobacterium agricola]UYW00684.1 GNAT family N-acetyltransferase [Flavobacterium agricola]
MKTEFKAIETKDISTLVKFMTDFYAIDGYPINNKVTENNFKTFISNPNLGQCFLILHNNQPAGYVLLNYLFSFEFGGLIAFLDELYIDANFQGKGLGKLAVTFAQEFAQKKDFKILYLEVELHNERAIELYKKLDFKTHHRNLMIWKNPNA